MLAHYLSDEDIVRLEELIIKQAPFPISRGFIHKASEEKNAALNGAGLFFMRHHREQLRSLL